MVQVFQTFGPDGPPAAASAGEGAGLMNAYSRKTPALLAAGLLAPDRYIFNLLGSCRVSNIESKIRCSLSKV